MERLVCGEADYFAVVLRLAGKPEWRQPFYELWQVGDIPRPRTAEVVAAMHEPTLAHLLAFTGIRRKDRLY